MTTNNQDELRKAAQDLIEVIQYTPLGLSALTSMERLRKALKDPVATKGSELDTSLIDKLADDCGMYNTEYENDPALYCIEFARAILAAIQRATPPAAPVQDEASELPDLPWWTKLDNLGGLVPSAVREEMRKYARAAIATREVKADADKLLRSLWNDTGLVELMRPDQVRQLEQYCAAPPASVSNPTAGASVRDAVAKAYGIMWHVNAGMDAPAEVSPLTISPERGAYEARKVLRDLLTHEQRGEGINAARDILAALHLAATKAKKE